MKIYVMMDGDFAILKKIFLEFFFEIYSVASI